MGFKFLMFSVTMWLATSWELMLGVGVIHLHWWSQVPPMGFTTALIVGFLFGSMLTGGTVSLYAIRKGWIK